MGDGTTASVALSRDPRAGLLWCPAPTLFLALSWWAKKAYIPLVTYGGIALGALFLTFLPREDTSQLALLVGITAVSQFASLSLFGPTSVSLSFPFTFLTLLWFGPGAAVLTVVAAVLVHAFYPVRRPWQKVAFNLGSLCLSVVAAGSVYLATGGHVPPERFLDVLVSTLLAAEGYFLVNTLTVSGAISFTSGQPLFRVWATNHRWLSIYFGVLAFLALAVATQFHRDESVAFLIFVPILAVPWAFTRLVVSKAKELTQEKLHASRLAILQRVGLAINGARSLDEMVAALHAGGRDLVGSKATGVFFYNKDRGSASLAAEIGLGSSLERWPELNPTAADLLALSAGQSPVTKGNEPKAKPSDQASRQSCPLMVAYHPLTVSDELLGAIAFYLDRTREPSEESRKLLGTLTEYAAGAVGRYFKDQELAESHGRLFQAQELARKQVAAGLHGTVQTKMLVVWYRLGQLLATQRDPDVRGQLEKVQSELKSLQDHVRSLSSQLHPAIAKIGLVPALRSLADRFEGVIEVDSTIDHSVESEVTGWKIPEETMLVLYRVAEEALQNVAKHARTNRATIRVWLDDSRIQLAIEDKGKGFFTQDRVEGLGLRMMQDYVNAARGTIELRSSPSQGTAVLVSLPLASGSEQQPVAEGQTALEIPPLLVHSAS